VSNWAIWVNLVGQIINAIAKAEGEPVEQVRRRLLADPRITSTTADEAAAQIDEAMPVDGTGPEVLG